MTSGHLQTPDSGREPAVPGPADLVLAERAATGDRAAFEAIYRRHCDRVYGLCLRLTADRSEAEILAQDTFVKAWLAIGAYRGQGDLGGWLARIATNRWRDRWRADARGDRLLRQAACEGTSAPAEPVKPGVRTGGPDRSQIVPLLTGVDLERGIARLPQGARTVFVLHEIEGHTHEDIGVLLGVATGTVKAQLHRARRLLRVLLADPKEISHGA